MRSHLSKVEFDVGGCLCRQEKGLEHGPGMADGYG